MALYNNIWDWKIDSQQSAPVVAKDPYDFGGGNRMVNPGAGLAPIKGLSSIAPIIDTKTLVPMTQNTASNFKNPNSGKSIYDKMMGYSKGLAAFEIGMSGISAIQALKAKPTTVTGPKMVNLQAPKIESEVESTRATIKENLGTGINTWLESSRERGFDPNRSGVGIFAEANRLMRQSSSELSMRNQDILNRGKELTAQIEGQEALANAEIMNRYIERKDAAMAADAEKRGMQLSGAVSNIGAIASRTMNDYLMTEILRSEGESDDMYYQMMMLQSLGLGSPLNP